MPRRSGSTAEGGAAAVAAYAVVVHSSCALRGCGAGVACWAWTKGWAAVLVPAFLRRVFWAFWSRAFRAALLAVFGGLGDSGIMCWVQCSVDSRALCAIGASGVLVASLGM